MQMRENGRCVTFWCKAGPVYDQYGKAAGAIESIRDISELKKVEAELKAKSNSLEDMNTALKVLLNQREQDRKELEEKLVLNIKELVLPQIKKLKEENKDFTFAAHLTSVENNLEEIFSPFIMNLTSVWLYSHCCRFDMSVFYCPLLPASIVNLMMSYRYEMPNSCK